MDLATLSFAIDSTPLDRARKGLDGVAVSADKAERSASNLTGAFSKTGANVSGAASATESAMRRFTAATNDNAKAVGLARHEWINLSRQFQDVGVSLAGGQSPLTVLLQQGSQIGDVFASSHGGATAALKEFGVVAGRALLSPIGVAATLTGGLLAVKAAGDSAAASLAALGGQSRSIGLSANEIAGAKIVGARAGLDDEAAFGALQSATRAFEQFGRNAGPVKDILENVDRGFLGVADRARSSAEWIDKVQEKIRALPKAQGMELSKALFGDDAGRKLFEQINAGAVSMSALSLAAERAGANFDVSAANAEKMRLEIAEIDAIASTRLLATFGALADPVLALERSWANMKLGIVDVERSARQLKDTLRFNAGQALGEHGEAASSVFARMRQQRLGDPFAGKTMADVDPLVNLFTQGQKQRTVGEDRALFVKPERAHGGVSAAEKEATAYAKITAELEGQIRLASSLGDAHEKVSLQLKIQAEQTKLGAAASATHKQHVADLVMSLDTATKAQAKFKEEVAATNEAYASVSNTLAGGIKDVLLKGAKPKDVLQNALGGVQNNLFDAALTGSGPFAKALGLNGKDGAVGGLFGGLGDLLGIGSGGLDKMTIQAREVKLTQAGTGGSGGVGGFLGNFVGGVVKGMAGGLGGGSAPGYFSSPLFSGYADGGIVGALGGHMMRAPLTAFIGAPHFASGGAVPVIAHAGEVILNAAQQRSVAAALTAARGSGNDNREMMIAPKTEVHIHGAPAGTKVTESEDNKGNRRIDAVIDERWAASAGTPQGQQAMRSAFGVGPVVARR